MHMSDLNAMSDNFQIIFFVGTLWYLMRNSKNRGKILLDKVVTKLETSRNRALNESEIASIYSDINKQKVQEKANQFFASLLLLTVSWQSFLVPRFINHVEVYNLFAVTIVLFGLIIYVLRMLAYEIVKPRIGIIISVGLIILFLESILSIILVYFYQS